jgi:AcrR family transcriptional regulator
MSPRRADPQTAVALVEAAATVLAEHGPQALSTRRLAAMVGTSTSSVYTHFRSMDSLIRAVAHEGFTQLRDELGAITPTSDPVADVILLAHTYRAHAQRCPHLYAVMFGAVDCFTRTDFDRRQGQYTMSFVVTAVRRSMAAGRLRHADPHLVTRQLWIALHGLITLEHGHHLTAPYDADRCYQAQLRALLLGSGDRETRIERSMTLARTRMTVEMRKIKHANHPPDPPT